MSSAVICKCLHSASFGTIFMQTHRDLIIFCSKLNLCLMSNVTKQNQRVGRIFVIILVLEAELTELFALTADT